MIVSGIAILMVGAWAMMQSRHGALLPPSLITIGVTLLLVGLLR